MMNEQVRKLIVHHDKEKLMALLSLKDSEELLAYLTNTLIIIILENNNTISYIDNIISFCYEIVHEKKKDYDQIYLIISKIINKINYIMNPYYKKLKEKDNIYSNGLHALAKLHSYNSLILNISKNKNPNCEVELLWYLITRVKNFYFISYLISKNPSILNLSINNENIIKAYVKFYLKHLNGKTDYYLKVLYLLLESKYPSLKKKDYNEILDLIDNNKQKNNRLYTLRKIINEYFTLQNVKTDTSNYIKSAKVPFINHQPWQIGARSDYRNLRTISIDSEHNKGDINYDDAFSLVKKYNHYILYIHISDVPAHIDFGSPNDMDIKKRLVATNIDEYYSLFERDFAHNYLSLMPLHERFTITFVIEFNNNGQIINTRVNEGIIKNDKAYTFSEVDQILLNHNNKEIMAYKELAQFILNHQITTSGDIVYAFNTVIGNIIGNYFYTRKLPAIYRNCIRLKDTISDTKLKEIEDHIKDNVSKLYLDKIISSFNNCIAFYDVTNYGHKQLNSRAYIPVSKPIRSYIDIANLRGVKEMYVKGKTNEEVVNYFTKYYEDIILRANALETVLKLTK